MLTAADGQYKLDIDLNCWPAGKNCEPVKSATAILQTTVDCDSTADAGELNKDPPMHHNLRQHTIVDLGD